MTWEYQTTWKYEEMKRKKKKKIFKCQKISCVIDNWRFAELQSIKMQISRQLLSLFPGLATYLSFFFFSYCLRYAFSLFFYLPREIFTFCVSSFFTHYTTLLLFFSISQTVCLKRSPSITMSVNFCRVSKYHSKCFCATLN